MKSILPFILLLVGFQLKSAAQTEPTITHQWNFDGNVIANKIENWDITGYSDAGTANGVLSLTGTKTYSNLMNRIPASATIKAATSKTVIIRLKNETAESEAKFYFWGTAASAAYVEFDIKPFDSEFREYKIDLTKDAKWTGDITIIRFDVPAKLASWSYGQKVLVDYIKLTSEELPLHTPVLTPMPPRMPAPFGINLAGADFGSNMPGVYGTDYGYPTTAELDYFKAKGLNLVRFTFKWDRIQRSLNEPLDPVELARMKKFVDAARERNIWILLDLHNYNRRYVNGEYHIIGSPALTIPHVTDVWVKLAREFKDYDNIWGYGLMNEPYNMLPSTPWFDIAQALITKIREVDTKTTIVVGGDSYSSAARWISASDNLKNLVDPSNNLIFEAHQYVDKDASGRYDLSYDEDGVTPTTGVTRLAPFVNWLKENKLRGFVGEYGVPDDDPRWLVVLDNMMKYMADNCINGTYWAAGPRWGTYKLAVEPRNWEDRPQMVVLDKYKVVGSNCSIITSSKAESISNEWALYPNPAINEISINLDRVYSTGMVVVIDAQGRKVHEKSFQQTRHLQLQLHELPAGLYLIKVTAGTEASVIRFVKQ